MPCSDYLRRTNAFLSAGSCRGKKPFLSFQIGTPGGCRPRHNRWQRPDDGTACAAKAFPAAASSTLRSTCSALSTSFSAATTPRNMATQVIRQVFALLTPPPLIVPEDYDGLEFRWKFLVFRPGREYFGYSKKCIWANLPFVLQCDKSSGRRPGSC
jgi:hypothetical protein